MSRKNEILEDVQDIHCLYVCILSVSVCEVNSNSRNAKTVKRKEKKEKNCIKTTAFVWLDNKGQQLSSRQCGAEDGVMMYYTLCLRSNKPYNGV